MAIQKSRLVEKASHFPTIYMYLKRQKILLLLSFSEFFYPAIISILKGEKMILFLIFHAKHEMKRVCVFFQLQVSRLINKSCLCVKNSPSPFFNP